MCRLFAGVAVSFLMACSSAQGQTASGPDAGSPVKPLEVDAVAGDQSGKKVDFVKLRQEQPTLYLFIQAEKWTRPMARFIKTLDQELDKGVDNANGAFCVAVWLTDDVSQSKEYLPRAQQSMQLTRTTLGVFDGAKAGPADWGINPDAHLTAVVARGGKVIKSFGYQSLNETNVPEVLAELKKK